MAVARSCNAETLKVVLGCAGETTNQTLTEMMCNAAKNSDYGPWVMKLLLDRIGTIKITQEVLVAAVNNNMTGNTLMKVLLGENREVELIKEVLELAIRVLDVNETMPFLLERVKAIGITEEFLEAGVRNCRFSDELLKLLMNIDQDIEVLDRVVTLAVANSVTGIETL